MKSRAGGIELQIERRGLGGLLLVAGEPGEAVSEGVGDAEHGRAEIMKDETQVLRLMGTNSSGFNTRADLEFYWLVCTL